MEPVLQETTYYHFIPNGRSRHVPLHWVDTRRPWFSVRNRMNTNHVWRMTVWRHYGFRTTNSIVQSDCETRLLPIWVSRIGNPASALSTAKTTHRRTYETKPQSSSEESEFHLWDVNWHAFSFPFYFSFLSHYCFVFHACDTMNPRTERHEPWYQSGNAKTASVHRHVLEATIQSPPDGFGLLLHTNDSNMHRSDKSVGHPCHGFIVDTRWRPGENVRPIADSLHLETRNQWARDDPSFILITLFFVSVRILYITDSF